MNILVTGANGQLGNEIRVVSESSNDNYIFTDVNQVEGVSTEYLDITNLASIRDIVNEHEIECVINCAAYTDVAAAESNFPLAERLNADAPKNLAVVMAEVSGLLVHISTDYVFGKEPYNVPCNENQKGTPTGIYGVTKLNGEENIIKSGCNFIIIRTAWLYSEYGKNFLKTMLALTASKPQISVVFDQVGTPTYALHLAEAIYKIISERLFAGNSGIYHYSNEGVCSWYDFAKSIAEYSGQTDCEILPCHSNEFPSPVVRPSYSVLDKTKIKEVFGVKVPYWRDGVKDCLKNM